jgi:predicted nucleic acid-binding protein
VALFYADASALVKLVREEPESGALRAFLDDADVMSSELVLTEVPRAIRRAVAHDPRLPLDALLERAGEVLDAVALLPLDRALLIAAGTLDEPALRALDAIHVMSALDLAPLDAFVSYDERQSAAARLAGLRTVAPVASVAPEQTPPDDADEEPPGRGSRRDSE